MLQRIAKTIFTALGIGAFIVFLVSVPTGRPKVPSGRTLVTCWSGWVGHENEAFDHVVDAFNRSQDEIFVVNTSTQEDDTKIFRAITAGVPPDFFQVWGGEYVGALAANDAVQPFNQLLQRDGPPLHMFVPGSLGLGQYEGNFYSMPFLIDAYGIYWNKDIFREAGLDPERPPRDLKELEDMALRLINKRPDGSLQRMGLEMPAIEIVLALFGGKFYDPKTHTILADHPRNVEALEWFVHMIKAQGGPIRVDSFVSGFGEYSSPNHQFFVGKVAMMVSGQWWPSYVERFAPHIDYGVAPLPYPAQYPELEGTTYIGGNFFCIPSDSRHPNEAWRFLRWTQTRPGQILFSTVMHGVPNMKPVLGSSELTTGSRRKEAFGVVCRIAEHPNAAWFPATPVNTLYISELTAAAQLAARGKKTPQQALRDVRIRVQQELDRYVRPDGTPLPFWSASR